MSFSKKVNNIVEETIKEFIVSIGDKYDIDPNDLYNMWEEGVNTSGSKDKINKTAVIPSATEELEHGYLLSCKVPELKALCKQRKLKCSGNKTELIALLLGKSPSSPTKKPSSPAKKSVNPTKKIVKDDTEKPVIKKLTPSVPTIPIRRNQFNNHEHPETGLVFCRKIKKVIGKQQDDGSISSLTTEDIENCNKFKFEYVLPENLDSKGKLDDDEQIEELEDEELIESDEDIEEEELIEDDDDDDDDDIDDDYDEVIYED